jgi:hypothetical protein
MVLNGRKLRFSARAVGPEGLADADSLRTITSDMLKPGVARM